MQILRRGQIAVNERRQQLGTDLGTSIETRNRRTDMDYCPGRLDTAYSSIFRPLNELLRIVDCGGGFVDEDSLSFIAGADMAILDAAKTFGLCFIALHSLY